MIKPFSQACENNAIPILNHLTRLLADAETVLEIGSGTGQHAICFAKALPHLQWQPSDLIDNHEGICLWLDDAGLHNVSPPMDLDLSEPYEDDQRYDAVFMSNTLHIIHWEQVQYGFTQLKKMLNPNGLLLVYGPFNYQGRFTSESNMRFEQWLKAIDPDRGIRDFERVNRLAQSNGLSFEEDNAMPANNRLLVWRSKR